MEVGILANLHISFQACLVDCDNFQTVTLVILESFTLHHFDKIHVGIYIRIIHFSCGAKSKYGHGDSPHVIKICSLSIEIMEISNFFIQIMFMHCDSIVGFITHKMQYVIACIADVVIQVHGLVNQKYEFIVADGTKFENIITMSLWKKKKNSYKELVNLFSTSAPAIIFFEECVINCLW